MIKKQILIFLAAVFFLPLIPTKADKNGDSKKGYQVMKKVRDQARIQKTQSSEIIMIIQDKKGRKRERYFRHLKKQKSKDSSSMVKFFKPASVKGTSLLSRSNDEEEDTDQWIYLPAFRSVKKLSSKEKGQSFMGSDFSNSDIAGRSLNQDKHKLVKEDKKYFYILSKPKDKKDPYSRMELKVHKKIYVPIEVRFYNRKKKHFKTMKNTKVKKFKGMYVVVKSEVKNLKTKGKTTLHVSKVKVGIDIPDSNVGIRGLKK